MRGWQRFGRDVGGGYSLLGPPHSGCGQWQVRAVTLRESSQWAEQYFLPSAQTQVHAEFPHFFGSVAIQLSSFQRQNSSTVPGRMDLRGGALWLSLVGRCGSGTLPPRVLQV